MIFFPSFYHIKKIKDHSVVVGVVGLGYVGLPFAVEKAKVGFNVIGFDIDKSKVNLINSGKSFIKHIKDEWIFEMNDLGFIATSEFSLYSK